MKPLRVIILGAAGRDFHDFLTFYRKREDLEVCCFTAAQIPFIERRSFPRELAGPRFDHDIPIHPESELPELIRRYEADLVCLAYSDLAHEDVMHKAAIAAAAGAGFWMLGPRQTELASKRPVIAVTAVRTGAGKSPVSQAIARHLADRGLRAGVLRHPMPYGDLAAQAVQRFAEPADLDAAECTVEEREEYAPYIEAGTVIWAGVDYERILAAAEAESDVILWDGGNNDTAFVAADLRIVVADALRPGHESHWYPGETNFRRAQVLLINKVREARAGDVEEIRAAARRLCPEAVVLETDLRVEAEDPAAIRGRRVLVVEDGPTLTHGGMAYGAGLLAARAADAADIIDPRPFACGSIAEAFARFAHIGPVLPALGYSAPQREELAATITAAAPEVVVDASPAGVGALLGLAVPVVRVRYTLEQLRGPSLFALVDEALRSKH